MTDGYRGPHRVATYLDRLTEAMTLLSAEPAAVFLGQAIAYPGTGMTQTFAGVPRDKLIELPVFEETQLGMSIGLSLAGQHPVVSVYPRINFLLLAMGQLVLHLDALPRYSGYRPRVIIRTAVAHDEPLNPGAQHLGDYSYAIKMALLEAARVTDGHTQVTKVVPLTAPDVILPAYRDALRSDRSTILVEYHRLYDVEDA